MKTKELCEKCGGVIGGTITSSATGEKPCTCRDKKKSDAKQLEIHWPNGRELNNEVV